MLILYVMKKNVKININGYIFEGILAERPQHGETKDGKPQLNYAIKVDEEIHLSADAQLPKAMLYLSGNWIEGELSGIPTAPSFKTIFFSHPNI